MMKAVRYYGKQDVRVDDIPAPTASSLKPDWVLLEPKFCGICGSDCHEFADGANLIPTPGHPHAITKETLPLTLGHEFSAVVRAVGKSVSHVVPGDRVCVQPIIYDGDCRSCVRGLHNCCDRNGIIGLSGFGGGLCEVTAAPAYAVKKLPDNISLEVGALVEPLAVGWHAVAQSPLREGGTALVLGSGPIGLAVVQALVARGCGNIIVSETSRRRSEFAVEFGAHHAIDPATQDLVAEVERLTDGELVDVAYDAAGAQAAVIPAFRAIKAGGAMMNIAVWKDRVQLDMNDIVYREKTYRGIATYVLGDFEHVIQAISEGKMTPERMITKKITWWEIVEGGFNALIFDKSNVKILVDIEKSIGK